MKVSSLVLRPTNGAPDMEALAKLRFEVYCLERGFLDGSCYPDGRETDGYDEVATHWIAELCGGGGTEVVGCIRLIPDGPLGLPVRQEFGVDENCRDGLAAVELSRYLLARRARQHSGEFLRQVCRAAYRHAKRNRVDLCYAILEPSLFRALRMSKLPFRQIGEPRRFMGAHTFPTVLAVSDVDAYTSVANPEFYAYLAGGLADDPRGNR